MRACPEARIARSVGRRLLGEGISARKADDATVPEPLGRPRKLAGGEDRRKRCDARLGPRDPHPRPTLDVFAEIAAIHSEEADHLSQAAFECGVQTADVHVNEPGRQI